MENKELTFLLDNNIEYYMSLLDKQNIECTMCCQTKDIYWTNQELNGLNEKEMKESCIRLRGVKALNDSDYYFTFQNYEKFNTGIIFDSNISNIIEELLDMDFEKIFVTEKTDYQYKIGNIRIQLQDIKDIGTVLCCTIIKSLDCNETNTREQIINEINRYGFNINIDELNFDKLRTLYYNKTKFS